MRKIIQEMIKQRIKDKNGNILDTSFDEFLVEQGMRHSKKPGRLKNFYVNFDHRGWYAFIFEHRSFLCTADSGLQLRLFVECGTTTVELNPVLQEQLSKQPPT